jgi:hypothetical protein
MPDLNPKSNIRYSDWVTGVNYKKHDGRFYQHAFVDTPNSVNSFTGVDFSWSGVGHVGHAHEILTPNVVKSQDGDTAPTQLNLQVQSKDASSSSYSTFNGNFGSLEINTNNTSPTLTKYIIAYNPGPSADVSFGLDFSYDIVSYKIIGSNNKHFSIYKGNKNYNQALKFNNHIEVNPLKYGSSDLEVRFGSGEKNNECKDFEIEATLKITYKNSSGDTLTQNKTLSGKLTITIPPAETVTIVAMSNELERMQYSPALDMKYQILDLCETEKNFGTNEHTISNARLHGITSLEPLDPPYHDEGPLCIKYIQDHRAGKYQSDSDATNNGKNISIGSFGLAQNTEMKNHDNSFFKKNAEAFISTALSENVVLLNAKVNFSETNETTWMTKNFNRLMDQMNGIKSDDNPVGTDLNEPLNWNSSKWPSIKPDKVEVSFGNSMFATSEQAEAVSTTRSDSQKFGHRNGRITITKDANANYPHSSSGEFICSNSPPNAWGFMTNTSENAKIYHNMATGWSADAGASNTTKSITIKDRPRGYENSSTWNLGVDDAIKNKGLSINSTRSWSEYKDAWSTSKNPAEDCVVTYPDEIKEFSVGNILKAIPSGQAACEEEFGSSVIHQLFDHYYSVNDPWFAPVAKPWLPFATIPPYVRKTSNYQGEYNGSEGRLNGSPDIHQGSFSYTDYDNTKKTVNWETCFAQAYVPLITGVDVPSHFYTARLKDNIGVDAGGRTVLLSDANTGQQALIAHTDLALLHISVS